MSSLFLCLVICQILSVDVNGLSIKLIHRDSPESPLYPGNLTLEETLSRLHDQINSYAASHFSNQSEIADPTSIRPPVGFHNTFYMAMVGIGTFDQPEVKYKNAYLMVDTGSELVWTQCEGCRTCFPQSDPCYPFRQSKSFGVISCDSHPLCYPGLCAGGNSAYKEEYAGHSVTQGLLATELFTFNSDSGGTEEMDMVFGCGFDQTGFTFAEDNQNMITGIMGLGSGPRSLVSQLGSRGLGLMSYCLPKWGANPAVSTFLRFGFDAQFKPGTQFSTTPLMRESLKYIVELRDISVSGQRLNYPAGTFNAGCLLDTGSPLILIKRDAYTRLTAAITSALGVQPESNYGFDFCYSLEEVGLKRVPAITFHLRNADLVVLSGAFSVLPDYICLCVGPHDFNFASIIIGNMAQSNYRFLYDLTHKTVSFAPEDCTLGS